MEKTETPNTPRTVSDLTRWEREILFHRRGTAGGFYTRLVEAFQHADSVNSAKLIMAFPDELGPWQRLRTDSEYCVELERIFSGV
jgi:hypothetical protein